MDVRNAKNISPLNTDHGEIVYELLGAAAGNSRVHSLAQISIPPGRGSRKHFHPVAEESYYILAGEAHLELEGETATLTAGDSIVILSKQVHQVTNRGDKDLVLLAVCVPAWTPDNSVSLD
jgi:mannose-6-phosphate isomerase-like protein (cupin superfamily)